MTERLASERRARLAAERILDLRSRELFDANEQLSSHALKLSDQIVVQRQETEHLKDDNAHAHARLEEATAKMVIAERRLWDSVETIADGFAVFDADNVLVAANSAWRRIFDPNDLLEDGMAVTEIMVAAAETGLIALGEHMPEAWAAELVARWGQDPVPEGSLTLVDGRHFRLVDCRSRDGDMVCLAQDITAIKRRETQLNEARESAEAAARAKSAFLANMSHELRTPLNGVVSMAELMLEMEVDEEQELYLRTIQNSGNALLCIINDVLDFSKLEAQRMLLHPVDFDLEKLIHEVLLLVAPSARDKNLSLLVDFDLFMPSLLVGDPGRLRQILTNLVGNAVKFTLSGHVLVRAVGVETDDGQCQLVIAVEDTGIGIPADKQDHIFGSFSQVDDARNREFEGTGLGLSICKQLVDLMDGEVWVDSTPGEGSCFGLRVTLPCVNPRRVRPALLEPGLARAMIVGGAEIEREVLRGQLAQLGIECRDFCKGKEALEALQADPLPHLVFVEDKLEDGPGGALVSRMRSVGLASAIILLTSSKAMKGLVNCGADALMARPVLRSDLFSTIATLERGEVLDEPILVDDTPAIDTPAPSRATEDAGKLRILAADDNKTNRFVFSKMVKTLDIALEFAHDGIEAVEKYQSFKPDIIFMDISMPRMDGRQATREIRKQELGDERVPIVALTAHAMTGDAEEILSHGLDHFLSKPLKKQALFDLIRENTPPMRDDPFPSDG